MGKLGRKDGKMEKRQHEKPLKLWWVSLVGLGVVIVIGLFSLVSRSESWGLPATPRDPRPATLSPELFSGKVREAYRIAQEVPELLERMPCYCGCYVTAEHRNNLDCYTDRHAVG